MRFRTETGSVYELDWQGNRIRRLAGTHAATPAQGADGEWVTYRACSLPVRGQYVSIVWRDGERAAPATITSAVTSIEQVHELIVHVTPEAREDVQIDLDAVFLARFTRDLEGKGVELVGEPELTWTLEAIELEPGRPFSCWACRIVQFGWDQR